ncbi:AraC family transcriptional regulator [Nakamurella lactea]|uniref:AraC family transcriptional regulator n=1 Tax=Nakamurella lactea TaxID=459515 RepID=UPI00040980E8|nr:helix-turn-helix transcriptional regulator [Nakamurella lactea]
MSITRQHLSGPTRLDLTNRERIDWHDHDVHQLIHPSQGVLQVSTPMGAWIVPPHRAVWVPAGVAHSHQAHGPTQMRNLIFDATVNPLRLDRPTVLAVSPLLREVIISLTTEPQVGADSRANLERVALDQLRRVEELPACLPTPNDPRLARIADLLHGEPSDQRSLADLGRAVGASERTLSRLFRQQTSMTFPQWRSQLRLQHSLILLSTGASVTSVGTACGYHSSSSFIETFRRAFGVTPGRYSRESHPAVAG